ncbi:hypothetical protein VA249_29860 [Vibrio alfacsensis]|uniref:hypothetical protein n=1 Tax=Vibrio alfacsensis TaxID=1074311 RepID=UPI001BF0E34C|nr:hypothetical protein [Vibrio alfacsensis]BBM66340.1 hypothetical protein VA249_29860 [Vibrio alfacsensis]
MGLCTNIEHWPMPAAIGMATEGVKAKYNDGSAGGGGFGAADYQIGSKLDGAKVLAAVERMNRQAPHLADWAMFAYASPLWNSLTNKERLVDNLLLDWVVQSSEQGVLIQERTYNKVKAMVCGIAGALALEQMSGALTVDSHIGVEYNSSLTRQFLIELLVDAECKEKQDITEGFRRKRTRYYQNHWSEWVKHVESIRTILINYDKSAQNLFKKCLQ